MLELLVKTITTISIWTLQNNEQEERQPRMRFAIMPGDEYILIPCSLLITYRADRIHIIKRT